MVDLDTPSGAIVAGFGPWPAVYRYRLWRQWMTGQGTVAFVMLNPSTADHERDDMTLKRCVRFAQSWGYRRLEVVNMYGLRATDPKQLAKHPDPVGPTNYDHLTAALSMSDLIVVAWGAQPGRELERYFVKRVLAGRELHCLDRTRDGHPRHPLYVPGDVRPSPWRLP